MIDLEQSFYYPLQLDLDLDRGIWDKETFDVEKGGGEEGWEPSLWLLGPLCASWPFTRPLLPAVVRPACREGSLYSGSSLGEKGPGALRSNSPQPH